MRKHSGPPVARLITHLLSPVGVAAMVFPGISVLGEEEGIGGCLVAVAVFAVLPVTLVKRLKTVWKIDDIYDPGPSMRARILALGNVVYVIGIIALKYIGAGPVTLWGAASFLGGSALVWGISRFWKISIHAVGVAGGAVILAAVGGGALWPVALAPVAVGWARFQLGAHTLAQVVAGSLLGAAVAGALLPLFLDR